MTIYTTKIEICSLYGVKDKVIKCENALKNNEQYLF